MTPRRIRTGPKASRTRVIPVVAAPAPAPAPTRALRPAPAQRWNRGVGDPCPAAAGDPGLAGAVKSHAAARTGPEPEIFVIAGGPHQVHHIPLDDIAHEDTADDPAKGQEFLRGNDWLDAL